MSMRSWAKHLIGKKTNRKILVFISDDWGDNRISDQSLDCIKNNNIEIPERHYLETYASSIDLDNLFNVLFKHNDIYGNHACITPFINTSIPNIDSNYNGEFTNYSNKPIHQNLLDFGGSNLIQTWKNGMINKLFVPELHGGEHTNIALLSDRIAKDDSNVKEYIKCKYYYPFIVASAPIVATYYFENSAQFNFNSKLLQIAIDNFLHFTGYKPTLFNPPNSIFHTFYYEILKGNGVKYICTHPIRKEPNFKGSLKKRFFWDGRNLKGITHIISNGAFEPEVSENAINNCLKQISESFKYGRPAIINTHRFNYVKGRKKNYTQKSLIVLDNLLTDVRRLYPDVEFLSMKDYTRLYK